MKELIKLLIVTLLLIIISPYSIYASFDAWEYDNGVPVRQALYAGWTETGIAKKSDGSWCLAWSDARNGSQDIYAQYYNAENEEIWLDGELRVAGNARAEEEPIVIEASDGAWIFGWYAYYCGFGECNISELYLQRIDRRCTGMG